MSPPRLSARARAISPEEFEALRALAFSSATVFERDGCTVVAFGRAEGYRLPLGLSDPGAIEEATARLGSLAPAGAGHSEQPMVVAALPFLPAESGELVVPALAVTSNREGSCAVAVAPEGAHDELFSSLLAKARQNVADGEPPDGFTLTSARSHADFLERVSRAVTEVRSGRLDKVVLAREVLVEANRPFRQGDLLERLRALHPSCTTFCVDGFLGATPELLIRRQGDRLSSDPLAGTAARSGDPEADKRIESALLSSQKDLAEHRAVVDSISSSLAPVMASLEVPPGPEIVELRNVSHLRTRIRGTLAPRPSGGLPSALEALALIHPTPAVSGSPVDVALEYLEKSEEVERGRYAGPVGWMRADGDGEFHLGIRSAVVSGSSARLFAGVGIVADSEPSSELRETQLKLQAVLAAAVRP